MPLFDRAIAKSQTEKGELRGLAESDFDLQNCVQWGVAVEGCRQEVVVMHVSSTILKDKRVKIYILIFHRKWAKKARISGQGKKEVKTNIRLFYQS